MSNVSSVVAVPRGATLPPPPAFKAAARSAPPVAREPTAAAPSTGTATGPASPPPSSPPSSPPGFRPVKAVRRLRTLYTQEQTDNAVHRERCRADRTGQQFSLVLFRMPRAIGRCRSLLRVARTVIARSRGTDEVGWYDDDTVCAVLPDTAGDGAHRFADNVGRSISDPGHRPQVTIYTYPGTWGEATPPPAPTATTATLGPAPRRTAAELMPFVSRGLTQTLAVNGHLPTGQVAIASLNPTAPAGTCAPTAAGPNPARPLAVLLAHPMPWWKRSMDVAGALFGLAVFSPVFALAAVAIKVTDPGPVLFCQRRAGLGGRPFKICKFRTMCVDAEAKKAALRAISEQDGPAFKLKRDPRVTGIGHLLRKTSLDELPQLWNVLKGDMSLVGPRPLPIDEQDGAERWQQTRLDVTPGLTCIWQVKGRSTVTFADWVRMDVSYMRRRTLWNDVKILVATVPAVLLRRGAR